MNETTILAISLATAFYMAWNIGANDVANAFGTSVGSGAVTFRRALILAAIFEFSGAFFVGAPVSDTIRGNIIRPELFAAEPALFAKGMLAALLAASIWLHLATYFGQPVSTTHAIIGGVLGFGVTAMGIESVQWIKLGRIAASWFVSPLVGGLLAFAVYYLIRKVVLHHTDPVRRARMLAPAGLGLILFIVIYSSIQSFLPLYLPACKPLLGWLNPLLSASIAMGTTFAGRKMLLRDIPPGGDRDLPESFRTVEGWFGRLQIVTACYMSFAHGANDVANAIGPVLGILQAVKGAVATKAAVPPWLLAFGGVGIVIGLAMYGRKVMEAVGKKITEVTPTRGFAAELGTASTVLVCSMLGLPISTTFVLVGAVMGVGFARGFGAIDLRVVRKIFLSWIVTIPASAAGAAVIYQLLRFLPM